MLNEAIHLVEEASISGRCLVVAAHIGDDGLIHIGWNNNGFPQNEYGTLVMALAAELNHDKDGV